MGRTGTSSAEGKLALCSRHLTGRCSGTAASQSRHGERSPCMGLAPTGVSGWAGGVPPAPVVPLVSDQLKVAQCCGPCPPPSTPTCIVPQRSCAQGLGSAQPPGDAPVGLQHREQDLRREKSPGLLLGLGRCFWVTHGEGRVRGGTPEPSSSWHRATLKLGRAWPRLRCWQRPEPNTSAPLRRSARGRKKNI